jgi:hypothetical protein
LAVPENAVRKWKILDKSKYFAKLSKDID